MCLVDTLEKLTFFTIYQLWHFVPRYAKYLGISWDQKELVEMVELYVEEKSVLSALALSLPIVQVS